MINVHAKQLGGCPHKTNGMIGVWGVAPCGVFVGLDVDGVHEADSPGLDNSFLLIYPITNVICKLNVVLSRICQYTAMLTVYLLRIKIS